LKADQEQRLKALCVRVDRLTAQEHKVWKDVAWTQDKSRQAQEKQWQRQANEAEKLRMDRELTNQEQARWDRAREMRDRAIETKDVPRLQKFHENRAISQRMREESERHERSLRKSRQQEMQTKAMQVEERRRERRQVKLQREMEAARREQARQEMNVMRFAELQEEIQNAELAIAVAEHEELSAVHRLQNSQTVRTEVVSQLQEIEKRRPGSPRSAGDADDVPPVYSPSPRWSERLSPRLGGSGSTGNLAAPTSARGRLVINGARSQGLLYATRTDLGLGQITEEDFPVAPTKKAVPGSRARAARHAALMSPSRPTSGKVVHRSPSAPLSVAPRNMQDRS
jgi:hypothetical protein